LILLPLLFPGGAYGHQKQYNFIWENSAVIAELDSVQQNLSGQKCKSIKLDEEEYIPSVSVEAEVPPTFPF
jgi:hypothetical protein